ncbi:MAG: DUF523 domain-containing protein [Oscillospiraceae bacterium]|nr:DUF523 domain-containing protein [Oscillospiraceae bacterium]
MILLSACLAGVPCRYDGASRGAPELMRLALAGEAVLVCPEVLGGLPVPRCPSERQPDGSVKNRAGADVTAQYRLGAERALAVCKARGCGCAVLKARSPACGRGQIYDGSFSGRLIPGDGVLAAALLEAGIPVYTEEDCPAALLQAGRPVCAGENEPAGPGRGEERP